MSRPDAAARYGHTDAEQAVSARMAEAYDAAGRGDYPTALAIWGPLAQAGVARAQNNVGTCFAEGLGVERDSALALRGSPWQLKLATQSADGTWPHSISRAGASNMIKSALPSCIARRPRLAMDRRKTC
jgi:hypothetical protein